MFVELWTSTKGGTRILALIRASERRLQIEAREPIPPPIMQNITEQWARFTDDDAFLRSLPVEFSGTYFRAALKA